MKQELPSSGKISEFETGAQRDTMEGKGVPSHLPTKALMRVSKRFEDGARKYNDHNWRKGIKLSRYVDAIYRHLWAFLDGKDEEDHVGAIIWNSMCLSETYDMIEGGELPAKLNDLWAHQRKPSGSFADMVWKDINERVNKLAPPKKSLIDMAREQGCSCTVTTLLDGGKNIGEMVRFSPAVEINDLCGCKPEPVQEPELSPLDQALKELPEPIYISGQMTGKPDHNHPAFHAMEDRLHDLGKECVNPARNFRGDTSLPRKDYMRHDIEQLLACASIVMLPGWHESEGASLESCIAYELDLPCVDVEELEHADDI